MLTFVNRNYWNIQIHSFQGVFTYFWPYLCVHNACLENQPNWRRSFIYCQMVY